jgi:peptidoglycan/LPS O-acetylase OafA/YrhL
MWYAGWTGVPDVSGAHAFTFYSFSTQAPCFAIGILVFRLLAEKQSHALAAGLLGLGAVAALWTFREHGDRYYLFNVAAYAGVAYALGSGKLGFLVNRLVCGIGLISYSAYFWHFIVIASVEKYLPFITEIERVIFVFAVSLLLSTLTYTAIERPMMRLGARLAANVGVAPLRKLNATEHEATIL